MFVQTNFQRGRHQYSTSSTSHLSSNSTHLSTQSQQQGTKRTKDQHKCSSSTRANKNPTLGKTASKQQAQLDRQSVDIERHQQQQHKYPLLNKVATLIPRSADFSLRLSSENKADSIISRRAQFRSARESATVTQESIDNSSAYEPRDPSLRSPSCTSDSSPLSPRYCPSERRSASIQDNLRRPVSLRPSQQVESYARSDADESSPHCCLRERMPKNNDTVGEESDLTTAVNFVKPRRQAVAQLLVDLTLAIGSAIGKKLLLIGAPLRAQVSLSNKVLSVLTKTRQNIELVSAFCLNFLVYQLETWRLLVDSAATVGQVNIGTGDPALIGLCNTCGCVAASPQRISASDRQLPTSMISISPHYVNCPLYQASPSPRLPTEPISSRYEQIQRPACDFRSVDQSVYEYYGGQSNSDPRFKLGKSQYQQQQNFKNSSRASLVPTTVRGPSCAFPSSNESHHGRIFDIGSASGSPVYRATSNALNHQQSASVGLLEHQHQHQHQHRHWGSQAAGVSAPCDQVFFNDSFVSRYSHGQRTSGARVKGVSLAVGPSSRSSTIGEVPPGDGASADQLVAMIQQQQQQHDNKETQQHPSLAKAKKCLLPENDSSRSGKLKVNLDPGRRSASPSKLSLAGAKRRLGFKSQRGLVSLSVQRSEEVLPVEVRHMVRQTTFSSIATDSGNESSSLWMGTSPEGSFRNPQALFIEGLGAGQIVSRQALVSPYLGDVQLSLSDRRGLLEVEVVRARRLLIRLGPRELPSPYVKVYLTKGKKCIAKCKTRPAAHSLDPLYQQLFTFQENYTNCNLQVIVWGNYGRKARKCLMGIVQISLDDIDLSSVVIDWYRLFNAPSMANSNVASKTLRHTLSASIG